MCGIAGVYNHNRAKPTDVEIIKKMNDIQRHRGPDDEGLYIHDNCILGHRRLAIIDLSKNGHQPFASEDGRYQLAYNGEIYNYIELRDELRKRGWEFRTKTDTEVLLKAYQEYGERCLEKFNGMFAFVIYDTQTNQLFLARDRVGIKPLYYVVIGSDFYFASEIKAFFAIPQFKPSLNRQAVFDYFVFNRTNLFDTTFYEEIKRVPKGHYGILARGELHLAQWWNPEEFIQTTNEDSTQKILETIEAILVSSVNLRMRSDVPVGSCLSGGLDSSILLGIVLKHKMTNGEYPTFTASFPGYPQDETKYIDALKETYAFKSYRTQPEAESAYHQMKEFVYTHDEPTLNAAYYAQYEVMRLAKEKGVTVLLDGQGGDENFAGYPYLHGYYLYGRWRQKRYFDFTKNLLQTLLRQQEVLSYQTLMFRLLSSPLQKKILQDRCSYLRREFFDKYIDSSIVFNKFLNADNLNASLVRHFQYKLEHLLHSEDRNSMAFSIETRVPYLDYRLIEYVLGVSEDLKIKAGETKYLQKQALGQYTIPQIADRRDKVGFDAPMHDWLKSQRWQSLAEDSYRDLKCTYPDIFRSERPLPAGSIERWKFIQLSTWKDIFL